jgi:hypothetical protein
MLPLRKDLKVMNNSPPMTFQRHTLELMAERKVTFKKVTDHITNKLSNSTYLSKTEIRIGIQDDKLRMPFEVALWKMEHSNQLTRVYDTTRIKMPGYYPDIYCLTENVPHLPQHIIPFSQIAEEYSL